MKSGGKYRFKYVFILTYGRSGSTLLMGILNAMPGVLIRGENYNFLYPVYQSIAQVALAKQRVSKPSDSTHPWFGAETYDIDSFSAALVAACKNLLIGDESQGPHEVLGFKEIRYFKIFENPDFTGYIDFINNAFPDSCFVLNTRNHSEVCGSAWWSKQDPAKLSIKLAAFEKRIEEIFLVRPNFYKIDYSDIVSKTGELAGLYEFLGADFDEAAIAQVLAQKHSY